MGALTIADLERVATEIRTRFCTTDDRILIVDVVRRIMGPDAIVLNDQLRGRSYLRNGRIVVNPNAKDFRFLVAHELAHWLLRAMGFSGDRQTEERQANYLAAAILAPRGRVVALHAEMGEEVDLLAHRFGVSQTAMTLRLAEVKEDERAVVTRTGNVLIRTSGGFPWADTDTVSVARSRKKHPRLAKTRLRGGLDDGRIALRAKKEDR